MSDRHASLRILREATLALAFGTGACAAGATARPLVRTAPTPPATRSVAATAPDAPSAVEPGAVIDRAALLRVLDAGVARFLGGVEIQPVLEGRRFVGFRIVSFYPLDASVAGGEISAGDVVVAVNDLPIERPEHAFRVWQVLRVASELKIRVLRGTALREVRYAIGE